MRIRTLILLCGVVGLLVALAPVSAVAQQTEKRSEIELLPVSPPQELPVRPWDPYTLSISLEFGGQIADVSGNHEVWEAQQNYRDGFRVFGFSLRGEAKDNKALFTDFFAEGGGWVNEPYSWVRFGLSRDKWFDFRGSFRESEYNWFFPNFIRSQHLNDTKRRLQNYKVTFFPKQKFRFNLGYKRNSSFGPTLTTLDFSRAEFPVFEPLRQTYDEYTLGAEWALQKWLIVGEYGYRFFRNDRSVGLFENDARAFLLCGAASCPNDPRTATGGDWAKLFEWERSHPSRGKMPFVSLNIVGRPHRTVEANARLVYSWGKSNFTRSEFFDGMTFRSGAANPSTTILMEQEAFGESKRPMTTLNGNLTWRPWREFTVTNNFEYYGYDIAGFADETRDISCGNGTTSGCPLDATPAVPGSALSGEQRLFTAIFFDLDTFRNRTELRYDFTNWLGVRGGFNYTHRTFQHAMLEQFFEDGVLEDEEFEVEGFDFINRSLLFGADLRFNRRAQFFFDAEVGNNTRVFTRTGPANLDRYRLRGKFEPWDGIRFNASWFIFDNQNFNLPIPNPAFGALGEPETLPGRHTARNRGFSADFQLARFERGYFDIGYSRNDVTTITDVAFFSPFQAGVSLYVLNDNYFYFDVGGRLAGKLYGEVGYRLVDSSGGFPPSDPPDACVPLLVQSCTNLSTLEAIAFFDGGLRYHMPNASLRYSFSDNVNWKAGWRFYRYNQEGGAFSDYKAHVVTTSLVLNF